MPSQRQDETRTSQEHQLFEFLQRLAKFRAGRRAIQIHLSLLLPDNRRPHHVKIAVNTFEFLVRSFDGQIFRMGNCDLVFVWKGAEIAVIDEAVMRLRHLFAHDPLSGDVDTDRESRFCSWFDLEHDYESFLATAQRQLDEYQKRSRRLAAIAGRADDAPSSEPPPLSPHRLGELVDTIARADLSNMMRRQVICAIAQSAAPVALFRELYISIDELREIVTPGYNIASDRWLFQHLTQTLDQRMLQLLSKNDDSAIASAFSVNLNVATLVSDRFLAFDAGLSAATRSSIVIELQLIDIFSDLAAYVFARDFVKERGYRICLDGVTERMLPFVDRDRLGLDLVKILWNPDILGESRTERRKEIRDLIAAFGRARVILCHCDTAEAVAVGQALGIVMFQGRHIDRLLGAEEPSIASVQKLRAAVQMRR
jgi:EAL domain-containing protein (putative c-di-GMP-specific phosphodiesterase class I)